VIDAAECRLRVTGDADEVSRKRTTFFISTTSPRQTPILPFRGAYDFAVHEVAQTEPSAGRGAEADAAEGRAA
jgi:hypothetical protein